MQSNVVGIQSAELGFPSAVCLFRLTVAESRETASVSLDSARERLASSAG
jgi:hypothetical protein